jgi:hypothetical protein
MQSKSLLIAIAAFAVTATSAQAYVGTRYLAAAGLTTAQQSALEEARTLRRQGDTEKARDVLLEAGLDEDTMESLREAARAAHEAMHKAIDDEDYEAFKDAIEGTPLADIITTEADFKLFVKAHTLRKEGEHEEAKEILDDLGVSMPQGKGGKGFFGGHGPLADLSDEQRDALRAARQANDEETVKAILKEAGIDEAELKAKHEEKHKGGR